MVLTLPQRKARRPVIDRGSAFAILTAACFGGGAPLAKVFVGSANVWLTAGILHFGSGLGLLAMMAARFLPMRRRSQAAAYPPLGRAEMPAMLVSILVSGCLGPALLMIGLAMTHASTVALLLNLEGLATMAIAWLAFRDRFEGRLLVGAAFILAGTALLTWRGDAGGGSMIDWGAVPVIAACIAWGVGNNYTRQLIAADPVQVTAIKGLTAGGINIALAMAFGAALPGAAIMAGMGVVGFVTYGLSFVFLILALRDISTARAGAYLSVGPFFGALLAVAVFGEPLTPNLLIGGVLMAVGVWLCRVRRGAAEAGTPADLVAAEAEAAEPRG
jgi:drug/metabolite transporter (DMT)-like permease